MVSVMTADRQLLDLSLVIALSTERRLPYAQICEQPRSVSSFSLRSVSGQVVPMTRVLRAASTTSLVMTSSSLIFRTRWI